MGYRHILNLYKNQEILMFRECYALEKIHGTSSNVKYKHSTGELKFFSGGAKHESFVALFDQEVLKVAFAANCEEYGVEDIVVYGEAYGGKMQGMKATYGDTLKFIAFKVFIEGNYWMDVPQAERVATRIGFEYVHYDKIETAEDAINAAMMADSVQAVRNGLGPGHMREGVVLRPLIELVHQNGGRIICKHKRPEFAERENTPKFKDPEKLKILEDAKAIADEWVTPMRLKHVLDVFDAPRMEDAPKIIKAMVADIEREAEGEIVNSKPARVAIGKKTMKIFKRMLVDGAFE